MFEAILARLHDIELIGEPQWLASNFISGIRSMPSASLPHRPDVRVASHTGGLNVPDLRIGVSYDFRNPPDSGVSDQHLYGEILEQVRWLDRIGADLVWFTEHHFVEDGYLPSWVPVAGAMASVTEHVRFGTDICLMPFNHPLRLAEDLAVLDNLSGGRVELGLGMGYAPHEFRGFGLPVSHRVSLMNEGIEVLQHCFRGERFSYSGKRYRFDDVIITPGYVQEGGPPLWIAAMSEAGAERAARYDTHFLPQGLRRRSFDPWVDALTEQRPQSEGLPGRHHPQHPRDR